MKNKIYYSAVILGNLNNIRCTEGKVKLIKYVVNNKIFTGGTNFKFKTGELRIKDIIDIENVRKKACKNYLPNNKLSDLSTPDKGHVHYQIIDHIVNDIFYDKLKDNKLKLVKVEEIKYTKENTGGIETIKEEKTEYNEKNNHLKDGTLANLEEVIDNDTDYIFYYNYDVTFHTNSLHIKYNNVEYTNKNEIKLNCELVPEFSNTDNFFYQIINNVFDKNGKTLDNALKTKPLPAHVLEYCIKFNVDNKESTLNQCEIFYEQLLYDYDSKTFGSLNLTIDQFYKYKIILKNIKGYYFKYDKNEKTWNIRTKIKEHQYQQFTEDSLNDLIKKELFLKDGYYKLTFDKKLNTDKKIDEDNEITLEFDIEKIKNDNDSKQFINTYLEEKQYVYKYRIINTPSGYKFKSDILKNADQNGFIKGKLSTIEEVKAKIKADLGLKDGEYELENVPDIERDLEKDSADIEINIKLKDNDKLKDKMFEKIPQGPTDKTSGTDNRGENEGCKKETTYCGSTKN